MAVNYTRLKSEYGFESPNFIVDLSGDITTSGNITAEVVTVSSLVSTSAQFYLENFVFDGSSISTNNNSSITFLTDVEIDNLILTNDFTATNIRNTSTIEIDSTERVTIKNSPLNLKSFTSVERDSIEPENGDLIFNSNQGLLNYYNNGWKSLGTGELVINGTTITSAVDNNITIDPLGTGIVIVNELKLNNDPVQPYEATRKDYVDRRITALAIALGV